MPVFNRNIKNVSDAVHIACLAQRQNQFDSGAGIAPPVLGSTPIAIVPPVNITVILFSDIIVFPLTKGSLPESLRREGIWHDSQEKSRICLT